MNKKTKQFIMISIIMAILFVPIFYIQAQEGKYVLLEGIRDLAEGATPSFGDYLKNLYNFILSTAAILGVVMLTVAGVQYASAGLSEKAMSSAKERATSAILGLLLALSAYLILYTINPKLLEFDLSIDKSSSGGTP